jgi:DNA (cytosine-5)-methyltransferase 1
LSAFYNENDPKAAAWLRELILAGQIAPGVVDERSISDIQPHELAPYTQCHFFAGIGGWSLALRLAGVPDSRPLWTGSCPCQPFSVAGEGRGEDDERHLWPDFFGLIRLCRPAIVVGEQVASKAALGWLDGVCADLEGACYAVGAADLCAACAGEEGEGWVVRGDQAAWEQIIVGAPHIRQRLYWLGHADSGRSSPGRQTSTTYGYGRSALSDGYVSGLGDTESRGLGEQWNAARTGSGGHAERTSRARPGALGHERPTAQRGGSAGGVGHSGRQGRSELRRQRDESSRLTAPSRAGPWSDFDIIPCRDGKSRRIESGTFPLVNGLPRGVVHGRDSGVPINARATAEGRQMRLRGYGNAIIPELAALFITESFAALADLETTTH